MRLFTYQRAGQARTGTEMGGYIIDLNRAYRASLQQVDNQDELAVADVRVPPDMIGLLSGGSRIPSSRGRSDSLHRELDFPGRHHSREAAGHPYDSRPDLVSFTDLAAQQSHLPGIKLSRPCRRGTHGRTRLPHSLPQSSGVTHRTQPAYSGAKVSDRIDYEGELAVIIGRKGKYIPEGEALEYVAGYTNANDVSARDLQFRTSQWTTGKMLDTFGPLGPALVTRDEVPDPQALRIKTILNGETMQDATTADMLFPVPFVVSYISQIVTLEPGDVIMTGTPPGIGNTRTPPVFLKPGDSVSVRSSAWED